MEVCDGGREKVAAGCGNCVVDGSDEEEEEEEEQGEMESQPKATAAMVVAALDRGFFRHG